MNSLSEIQIPHQIRFRDKKSDNFVYSTCNGLREGTSLFCPLTLIELRGNNLLIKDPEPNTILATNIKMNCFSCTKYFDIPTSTGNQNKDVPTISHATFT